MKYKEYRDSFPLGKHLYGICAGKFNRKKQNVKYEGKWEWDLFMEDLTWPTHCPVLGLSLLWDNSTNTRQDASPSFMRHDETKGFVKGNVSIVSLRACMLRGQNYSLEEYEKLYKFLLEQT